jgi:ATP-dependent DNA ligase
MVRSSPSASAASHHSTYYTGFGTGEPRIVLYAFDLLMLRGKDLRFCPLQDRRGELRAIIHNLPDTARHSETFDVPLAELERTVREHHLEGIVAKRAGSPYRSGERCGDWLKWRANRSQEFVIGGYIPNGSIVDALLVGYYEGRQLLYAASVRTGILYEFKHALLPLSSSFRYLDARSSTFQSAATVAGEKALRPKK